MNLFFNKKLMRRSLFQTVVFAVIALCVGLCFTLCSCGKSVDYFSYVSELRNNIFLAEHEDIRLRVYSVVKETPYVADGIARERSPRTEIYLFAPEGTETYNLHLCINDKKYGGELAYDNVKSQYFLSFTLDVSNLKEIPCVLEYGQEKINLTAASVLRNETVSPKSVLDNVRAHSPDLFKTLTDKYGFQGEIYLRLLYEDAPYYYVGVIDRNGNIFAFLVNATTGKVLAERKP